MTIILDIIDDNTFVLLYEDGNFNQAVKIGDAKFRRNAVAQVIREMRKRHKEERIRCLKKKFLKYGHL